MNPLKTIKGTLILGFVTAVVVALLINQCVSGSAVGGFNKWSFMVWLHAFFGVIWVGLLYYFNFVQVPAMATATADSDGPGPAAIGKYVAPLALLWFRWAALLTWLTGAAALEIMPGISLVEAFTLSAPSNPGAPIIGTGAWLGTIMLFNVWVLIWPNQKKILGIVEASDEEKAKARVVAAMASRTNTFLSIPMLMCMVGYGHNLPF